MKGKLEHCLGVRLQAEGLEGFDHEEAWFEFIRLVPTVKEIFKRLDPLHEHLRLEDFTETRFEPSRYNLECALGMVEDQTEWARRLAPDSPALLADQFHSWVWNAAQPFWSDSHHRAAVHAAAVAINANTQKKVGRSDVFDDDLMSQVFSSDSPKPGKPRLRLPGDPTDKTLMSRQRALSPFAQGCFAGIRNLAAHEYGPDWSEQRALQSLACFSTLAGWIDECEVLHDQ